MLILVDINREIHQIDKLYKLNVEKDQVSSTYKKQNHNQITSNLNLNVVIYFIIIILVLIKHYN